MNTQNEFTLTNEQRQRLEQTIGLAKERNEAEETVEKRRLFELRVNELLSDMPWLFDFRGNVIPVKSIEPDQKSVMADIERLIKKIEGYASQKTTTHYFYSNAEFNVIKKIDDELCNVGGIEDFVGNSDLLMFENIGEGALLYLLKRYREGADKGLKEFEAAKEMGRKGGRDKRTTPQKEFNKRVISRLGKIWSFIYGKPPSFTPGTPFSGFVQAFYEVIGEKAPKPNPELLCFYNSRR